MKTDTTAIKNITEELLRSKDIVATFKISEPGLNAIEWLSKRYKISVKKLFDSFWSEENIDESIFKIIAKVKIAPNIKRIKKSQRVSQRIIDNLYRISKKYNISRDTLVEQVFIFVQMMEQKEIESIKENHKKALKMIKSYWNEGKKLHISLKKLLDKNDPIISRFRIVNVVIMNLSSAIENELQSSVLIDPDDYSQSL